MAVHVLLNEIGEKFEAQKLSMQDGEHKKPDFLKINPRGQVPVLQEDGKTLLEGAAILTYLCDKHKSPLLPQSGWDRAEALQWLMFGNSTLHNGYSKAAFIARNGEDGPAKDKLVNAACDQIQEYWNQIETHLAQSGKPYVCGDKCTIADILIAVIANWGFLPRQFSFGPKTKALLKSVIARPAYQKAIATEQVDYKAAA